MLLIKQPAINEPFKLNFINVRFRILMKLKRNKCQNNSTIDKKGKCVKIEIKSITAYKIQSNKSCSSFLNIYYLVIKTSYLKCLEMNIYCLNGAWYQFEKVE